MVSKLLLVLLLILGVICKKTNIQVVCKRMSQLAKDASCGNTGNVSFITNSNFNFEAISKLSKLNIFHIVCVGLCTLFANLNNTYGKGQTRVFSPKALIITHFFCGLALPCSP